MKHKVSELEGALLDRAVGKVEGYEIDEWGDNRSVRENGGAPSAWHPSTEWKQGGPIIEREGIELLFNDDQPDLEMPRWCAGYDIATGDGEVSFGATALIAAMRAYVASKFGEEVELP